MSLKNKADRLGNAFAKCVRIKYIHNIIIAIMSNTSHMPYVDGMAFAFSFI